MADGIQLTPEELQEALGNIQTTPNEAAPAAAPQEQGQDVFQSLDAQGLANLAIDTKAFNPVRAFKGRKELWGDPNMQQKVADANWLLEQRGWQWEDLPSVGQALGAVADVGKGLWKQAKALASIPGTAVAGIAGAVTGQGPEFDLALIQQNERELLEANAGTEQAMTGLAHMGKAAATKAWRILPGTANVKDWTPEQRKQRMWDLMGEQQMTEDISQGKGAVMSTLAPGLPEELAARGEPVRPEEVGVAAAGDPLSFWIFGKGFGALHRGAAATLKSVAPVVPLAGQVATGIAGEAASRVAGRGAQFAGWLTEQAGKGVEKVAPAAKYVAPVVGGVEAGIPGAAAGLAFGKQIAKGAEAVGAGMEKVGAVTKEFGKQVAGAAPVTMGAAQLAKDVIQATPSAAASVAGGAMTDLGLSFMTATNPEETQGAAGLGTFFGLTGAGAKIGRRVISGQIAAPREWGSQVRTRNSMTLPALDQMSAAAESRLAPGQVARLNAVRQVANRFGTDVFFGSEAEITKALTDTGIDPAQAAQMAAQSGVQFTLPNGKKAIVLTDLAAGPHEARHPMEDVIGEPGMRELDAQIKADYGPQFEVEGQKYAARLLGMTATEFANSGRNWRDVVVDATNGGWAELTERLIAQNQPEGALMTEARRQSIADFIKQARERGATWRDFMVEDPEAFLQSVADRYIAREIAAENFDAAMKNMGAALKADGPLRKVAYLMANAISALGGEPLEGRVSEAGYTPLKFETFKTVAEQGRTMGTPVVEPAAPRRPVVPVPGQPRREERPQQEVARDAEDWAAQNEKQKVAAIQSLNGAIENKQGVRLTHLSAKGTPAGDPSAVRPERRAEIEAARGAQPADRQVMEKDFFPYRVVMTKSSGPQYVGWSPNNLRANLDRLTGWMAEVEKVRPNISQELLPFMFDEKGNIRPDIGFENDARTFVQNQLAGGTGSGRELAVPADVQAAGFRAPERTGSLAQLPQERADVINYLFASKLPGKEGKPTVQARRGEGELPLNVAGQRVAEATAPGEGRVTPLVEPRTFEGKIAREQGVEGAPVQEVNPFRAKVEAIARETGVAAPQLIEVSQRLNARDILDATIAPELERFGANTLTLQAGFQPKGLKFQPKSVREYSELAKDYEKWRAAMNSAEGGLTGEAYRLGAETKTPEALAEIKAAQREWQGKFSDAIKSGNLDDAQTVALTAQFFREAGEAATGTGSAGQFLRKSDPNYRPPLEGVKFQAKTEKGKELEKAGYEFTSTGSPLSRSVFVKKGGVVVGEITSTTRPPGEDMSVMSARKDLDVTPGKLAHLDFVEVNKPERGKGLGEALYRELLTQLQADGVEQLTGMVVRPEPIALREKVAPGATDYYVDGERVSLAEAMQAVNEARSSKEPTAIEPFTRIEEGAKFQPGITWDELMAREKAEKAARKAAKATPVKAEFKMGKSVPPDGFKKAWLLPDGTPVQLGGQWHEAWLSENNDITKKWGLRTKPFEGYETDARSKALQKGFARVNYSQNGGELTVEIRQKNWTPDMQGALAEFVRANADQIDFLSVKLLDEKGRAEVEGERVDMLRMNAADKPKNIPLINVEKEVKAVTPEESAATVEGPNLAAKQFAEEQRRYAAVRAKKLEGKYEPKPFSEPALEDEITKMREGKSDGNTFTPAGAIWTAPEKGADIVSLASDNIPLAELTRERVLKAFEKYVDVLDEPNVTVGLFKFTNDAGKEMVSADLNAVVPPEYRENTLKFAKDNDQIAIWDAKAGKMVEAGGKGNTKITKTAEMLSALDALTAGKEVDVEDLVQSYKEATPGELFTLQKAEGAPEYSRAKMKDMSREELLTTYPEAIVPKQTRNKKGELVDKIIPSELTEAPLLKGLKTEEEKVARYGEKLVEYLKPWMDTQAFKDGSKWYTEIAPRLKKTFGEWAPKFAELLAASSPNTAPKENFEIAYEAIRSWQDGRFDKIISKYHEGLTKINDGSWETWLDEQIASGKASKATASVKKRSEATFLAEWVFQHDLKPRKLNGKLYGMHGSALLQVFSRVWLEQNRGPKTLNFIENLLGISHEATVDVWADRTLRQVGYEGFQPRWRILPKNKAGVSDKDFAFAQKVFRAAANKLGVEADALQGAAWFATKVDWAQRGWGELDLGDYRTELKRVPMLERAYQKGKTEQGKQGELGLVEPR